jgi:hypothetical protein
MPDQPSPESTSPRTQPLAAAAVSRRALLSSAGAVAALAWLQGCSGGRRIAKDFPSPVWPEKQASLTPPSPPTVYYTPTQAPSAPSAPAPQPASRPQAPTVSGIIARSQWTRNAPRWNLSKPMNGVGMITVHHDALNASGLRGWQPSVDRLNKIRRAHLDRGPTWVDIGYHYVIDTEGRVWEGRPASIEGAHVAATNDHNLGIMLMGNFMEHRPTQAQLNTLDGFLAAQMRAHRVAMGRVYTHREFRSASTECPGDSLQSYMMQTRSSRGRLAKMV